MRLLVMDPAKLKVVELRSELGKRGLDTKGNKAVLVERLRKALEEDTGDLVHEAVSTDSNVEASGDTSSQDERDNSPEPTKVSSPVKTPGRSPRSVSSGSPTKTPTRVSPKTTTVATPIAQETPSPVKSPIEKTPAPIIDSSSVTTEIAGGDDLDKDDKSTNMTESQNAAMEQMSESSETEICTPRAAEEAPEMRSARDETINESEPASQIPDSDISKDIIDEDDEPMEEELGNNKENDVNSKLTEDYHDDKEFDEEMANFDEDTEEKYDETEEKLEQINNDDKNDVDAKHEESTDDFDTSGIMDDQELKEELMKDEEAGKDELKSETNDTGETAKMETDEAETKSNVKQECDEKDTKDYDRRDRKERKRKRSTSSQEERHKSPSRQGDDEPEIDYSRVLLSWYDSDLNLVIDKTKFLSATPMHNDGFGYVWAGARASFGFTSGKIYYEVKITHQCNVNLQDEEHPHILRAGWSAASTSMQLGETIPSYGYDSTGKKSIDNNFSDYGTTFGLNDILGCYLDMTSDDDITMTYTLNGENLGEAFRVLKSELDGKALFPHVLTKNCAFVCNFGDEDPWDAATLEGYIPVGQVDIKDRTPGPRRPDKREECEMLMICGLPASGKTVWAHKLANDNPEKMYNILGTNNLFDKMKVTGVPRKRSHTSGWDALIEKCTRCLNKLVEVAATRRRNYILDQTIAIYASEQRRKMRHFYGFQRKAIVIIPTDEEFKSRTAKRENNEGKEVPDSAMLEMKANFSIPVVGESFDSVEFTELDEDESKKIIAKYNKEGKDAGYTTQQTNSSNSSSSKSKRPRFEKSDSHRDSRDVRSSRDSRDNRDHRDRRSGYSDRNRNSSWRGGNHMGGGSGGGWRDRGPRSGPHMRHSGNSYGSSSGWRGRGGQSSSSSHRGSDRRGSSSNDRRSGIDRNRSGPVSRQGGSWGPMNSNYHNSSHSSGGWSGNQHSSGWSGGQSSSQGNWSGQQSSWGQQQNWGSWKNYGQSNYNQSNYSQQGYGNGNWSGWNPQQQYYNQYWGQQSQSITSSGQTSTSGSNPTSSTANSSSYNSYPSGWQEYSQSYYSTDGSSASTQQQK